MAYKSYSTGKVPSTLKGMIANTTQMAEQKLKDTWERKQKEQAKTNKTPTRDYFYSLGESRGMTKEDVDKLISWDSDTGQVSFGGKNIGTPDSVVDGVSYWSDTKKLDDAFGDYIARSGNTRSNETMLAQENENLFRKLYGEYDDLKNTDPFSTEEAKAILGKYDLAALQGRDNAVAESAGTNGGNIDSFAAANALRQQAALVNQGQMAVLSAHQQKLDHARSLLSDLGVHIDRVYSQNETTKNNQTARLSEQASITGNTPPAWILQSDPFYSQFVDENGKLKKEYESTDFQARINDAKAKGDTDTANKYAVLRGIKIFGDINKYGTYMNEGDIAFLSPQKTAAQSQFEETMQLSREAQEADDAYRNRALDEEIKLAGQKSSGGSSSGGSSTGRSSTGRSSLGTTKTKLTPAQAQKAIEDGIITQSVLDDYNAHFGTSLTLADFESEKNSAPSAENAWSEAFSWGRNWGKEDANAPMTQADVDAWVKNLNNELVKGYDVGYTALTKKTDGNYTVHAGLIPKLIKTIYSSDDLTQEQMEFLLLKKFGITKNQINAVLADKHYD